MGTTDHDSLHILPLDNIALKTNALRKSRIVKNSQLQGMVELFNERGSGSGQVEPDKLFLFFDLDGDRASDLELIRDLSRLKSYDVYSLRVSLRRLGVPLENQDWLKLSDAKTAELSQFMAEYTRPLVQYIYGDKNVNATSLAEVFRLFTDPDVDTAHRNLLRMADSLEVDIERIPNFLEDYADVYMSLSFYRQCLERVKPPYNDFKYSLASLKREKRFADDRDFIRSSEEVEDRLEALFDEVAGVLTMFRTRTEDMWDNISGERYRQMERMVLDHQTKIGAILCALTVKFIAWEEKFPSSTKGWLSERADFVIRTMKHGLNDINEITYADV